MNKLAALALAGVFATVASVSQAVTITVTADGTFTPPPGSSFVLEDFESLGGTLDDAIPTAVGTFQAAGAVGSGGTVIPTAGDLVVRNDNAGGRFDVVGGAFYLDTNDNEAVIWNVDTGSAFDTIVFSITDATDVGATLTITADGGSTKSVDLSGLDNGNLQLITVKFGAVIPTASIVLENSKINDGFGLDGAYVGVVPLPASALLMLGGLGAIGALRLRRKA
ncbi:MAG: VPLPA-CTERM sorting domain-containing protein [Pseudomonadota bacterium]